jgi:predicted TIM-barrel fold metal-dependent hydrolase
MRIDCDVHCAVPSIEALHPYLSRHWRDFLGESGFGQPNGVAYTYPSWSALAPEGGPVTLEGLQRDVLDHVSLAILHCYYGLESVLHPYLARDLATAVNQWLQHEWLDRDERLRASAVITPHLTEFALEEVERVAADPRFVQLLVPARAWDPYGNQRYWPIWEAAADRGLTVGITFGGATGTPPTPSGWPGSYFEEYALATQVFQAQLTSLIVSGVFARFPDLRIVMLESGWTWLPASLWRMDAEWRAVRRETPWVSEPPSAYVRRHVRFTTHPADVPPDPRQLEQVLEQLGSDELLLYGSDYPRRYPETDALLEGLPPDLARRVAHENAAAWYPLGERLPA